VLEFGRTDHPRFSNAAQLRLIHPAAMYTRLF
jgi:hypothetical protein